MRDMKSDNRTRVIPFVFAMGAVAALVAGCATSREKVQLRVISGGGLAVMTFDDRTGGNESSLGSQVAHQFASRLALGMGNVVEPHQLEALFAERGEEVPLKLTAEGLASIREVTQCDVLIVGSVNNFSEGEGGIPPNAAVSIRLVDLASGHAIYSRGKVLPGNRTNLHQQAAGDLVLDCADFLADRMSVEIAFVEENP